LCGCVFAYIYMQVYMVAMVSSKNIYRRNYIDYQLPSPHKIQSEPINTDLNSHSTCLCL